MRAKRLLLCAAAMLASLSAAEPKLKPRHDPPEQLFRRAPMAQSARSIVVNLGTNLHYAFDADLTRVHTVWTGGPLNLWGPPYSYAKAPFICDFEGTVLYTFPQVSPWWLGDKPVRTRFRELGTTDGTVSFAYDLELDAERVRVIERDTGSAGANGWCIQRRFEFPQGCGRDVSLLLFGERGATAASRGIGVQVTSTNGVFEITAGNGFDLSASPENVSYETVVITEEGTEKGFRPVQNKGEELRARLVVPRNSHAFAIEVKMGNGSSAALPPSMARPKAKTYFASSGFRAPGGDEFYRIEYFPLPTEAELLITGMDWLPNGDLAVCTWLGDLYLVHGATGDVRQATYERIATGLAEPLGLAVDNGEIFVVQKGELTRVVDSNHDGVIDRFECINSSWGFSGNYHSYSFGPLITPTREFFVFVTGQRGLYDLPFQGWALRMDSTGENVQPFCSGLRVTHGWGLVGGEIFVTDNQGNWIGACRLNHLEKGKFYGFPSSRPAPKTTPRAEDVEPPVLWFPRSLAPSASGFDEIRDERFGPFKGQLLIGDFQNSVVMRACLEKVKDRWQGAVFPFAKGFLSGINRVKLGPDGKLYVGGGKRTWSTAAPKEASLDRVAFTGKVPFEVQEVHALRDGFELKFTKPIDRKSGSEPANYLVKQFAYKYHQEYGSPEFDHDGKLGATEIAVAKVDIAEGRKVRLTLPALRTGFVTSFQITVSSAEDEDLRNDTFYYTLNALP